MSASELGASALSASGAYQPPFSRPEPFRRVDPASEPTVLGADKGPGQPLGRSRPGVPVGAFSFAALTLRNIARRPQPVVPSRLSW
jgi:hypothetical protein